ncbi:MAG: hypothetical protein WAW39_01815 [Prosthecobacter sp.]|uniref:hypothetical protein n=1 Tax=Prosthecobacter sp. TaxID=1965333 RepID=UPI003BB14D66
MTATLLFRIMHQFRTEWRHHWVWILAWIAATLLHRYCIAVRDIAQFDYAFGEFSILMMVLIPATVVWLCIRGDSPSNTDCATLTRPVGQVALWLGKLAFLCCGIVLPLLMVESTGWAGFQLGMGAWLALGSGLMLSVGLVIGMVSALTALTSTTRQVIAIAVVGVLAAGLWLTGGESMVQAMWQPAKRDAAAEALRTCGHMVASVVAFLGGITAWWLATVPRRRAMAAALLVISLMQAPMVSAMWSVDWITPPPLYYPAKKLGVKTGKADPADKMPGRALWPTLRITGLGKDEVASVIDLAPINEGQKEWPPLGSYSDLVPNTNGYDSWLHLDHLRVLLKHSAPTTLWRHQLNNTGIYNGRLKIQEALKPLRLDPKTMPARWRLRLAVHEMRRIGSVPLRDLWSKGGIFPVRPGLRVEFPPFVYSFGSWESKGCLHRVYPLALPPRDHRPAVSRGQALADGFLFVLEDPELRENEAHDLGPQKREYAWNRSQGQGFALQADESQGFDLRLWTPVVQHELLKTTHEEWVKRLNMSLWHAEERGTIDLELTAAQMEGVLAETKPEVKKP